MTEKSYFWDGTTSGDADQAPYSADRFTSLLSALYTSDSDYVFGGFAVVPSAGRTINIQTGFAFIRGHFFSADASVLPTVPANTTGSPRIDRVIVRINKNTSTGRVLLLQGTPSSAPIPPSLSTDPDLLDMSLARIYVPNGLAVVLTRHIVDERRIWTVGTNVASQYVNENVMPNSEFVAGATTGEATAPAMWSIAGSAACEVDTKLDNMARGSVVKVTCPTTNDGITITVPRLGGSAFSIPYTLQMYLEILDGEVFVDVTGGFQSLLPPTGEPQELTYHTAYGGAGRDMTLTIYNPNATPCIFRLGQVLLTPGYSGAGYLAKKELIFFANPLTQTGYDLGLVSDGVREIEIESPIMGGISALISRLEIYGGNSNIATLCYAALQDIDNNADQIRVENVGHTSAANGGMTRQGFIGIPFTSAGEQKFQLDSNTDAASSMNLGIFHLGCQT